MAEPKQAAPYVFLSYASADRERALHIADLLEAQGISAWIDRKSIPGGTSWGAEIVRGIEGCAGMVILSSAAAMASPNVQQEIQLAWDTQRPIFPFILEQVRPPEAIRYALAGRQWVEILDRPDDVWVSDALRALANLVALPQLQSTIRSDSLTPSTRPSSSSASPHQNLPAQLSSFIGREDAIAHVRLLLESNRLVTLTGAGGIGKTRLAIEVARVLTDAYADGVWLVELASLTNPALVASAVLATVGARETAGQSTAETVTRYLRPRTVLLVLDNCEHLIDPCAQLSEALLKACPQLRVLATSREKLGVAGETVWQVPSLDLPDRREPLTPAALTECEAGRLFVARATSLRSDFAVTHTNAQALAEICQRLDGIPLAIELASARITTLTVDQIAQRLDDRFRLLTGGSRTALPRQRTLRALIDWSYDLLTEDEQTLLRSVSVFAGGFSLAAAEAVCGSTGDGSLPNDEQHRISSEDVPEVLGHLVEKSLIVGLQQNEKARYRLLETIREYANERLQAGGEAARLQKRHADVFLSFAETEEPKLTNTEQSSALSALDLEHANLRVAQRYLIQTGDVAQAVRLGGALWRFWWVRSYLDEGREQLDALTALAPPEPTVALAKVRLGAGAIAFYLQDYPRASSHYDASLTMARELGDRSIIAWSLIFLGWLANDQGDYSTARTRCEEGLAVCQEIGDQQGIARSLSILGLGRFFQGDAAAAGPLEEQSLAIGRALGDRWGTAWALQHLGLVRNDQGNLPAAEALMEESRAIWTELGDRRNLAYVLITLGYAVAARRDFSGARALYREGNEILSALRELWGTAVLLMGMAVMAAALEQWPRGYRLLGAAGALGQAIGAPAPPVVQRWIQRAFASAPQVLGEAAIGSALAEGQAMTTEQAIAYAMEEERG